MSELTVFVGLDVGKSEHHCTALNVAGERLVDRPVANDEQALRQLFAQLTEQGQVVVVVDQPASIGALPVAVAQDMGLQVAYVIADAARTLPHTLRSVDIAGPAMADLVVLMGYDDLRD